jgi:predicted glycosyltransferase involved in capsule biosynthesis
MVVFTIRRLCRFLSLSNQPFVIYIVEQSDDGRKFNRGQLLNIGFDVACKDMCDIFVFHDVDLIPSDDLLSAYTTLPLGSNLMHIAKVWDRYNSDAKYFGGIMAFSKEQFQRINGFPNNFWGWGGEDNELYLRSKEVCL